MYYRYIRIQVLEMMEKVNPWTLLRAGEEEQEKGLREIQRAYILERSPSKIKELGVAYLWLYQYQQALEHFHKAIKEFHSTLSSFYGMAGVAKWCLGEPSEAISQWRAGLRAQYADTSGLGVKMRLLLFFVSVVRSDLLDNGSVRKLLQEVTADRRLRYWPGPIAQYILGEITADEFQAFCKSTSPRQPTNERDTRNRQWLAEFYRTLKLGLSTQSMFKESMRKLSDTDQPARWDESTLVDRIWHEEYFLARHEAI
jgi:tetratricopeptide (TPR) repeat protein